MVARGRHQTADRGAISRWPDHHPWPPSRAATYSLWADCIALAISSSSATISGRSSPALGIADELAEAFGEFVLDHGWRTARDWRRSGQWMAADRDSREKLADNSRIGCAMLAA
jgi:hypothetical protein